MNQAAEKSLNSFWDICIKVITPLVLLILLIYDLRTELSAPYEGYSWTAILLIGPVWLIVALIISVVVSKVPWKRTLQEIE